MMDKSQSILEHLTELRQRIVRSAIAVAVCVMVAVAFSHRFFTYLMSTATEGVNAAVKQTHFSDAFLTEFKLAVIGGLVLAFPFVLYQLIAFIIPALRPSERRLLYIGLPAATGLFLAGWSFGWFVVVPITKQFMMGIADSAGVGTEITPSSYISFVLGITNPLGIAFQLPLVVVILAQLGIISAGLLGRIRKFAILGILILAAVLSPPDVISMGIFFVPLYGLYEISILLARVVERRKQKA